MSAANPSALVLALALFAGGAFACPAPAAVKATDLYGLWRATFDGWIEAAGTGTVYTYSTHFIGPSKAYKGDPPHIVALIDLDEGPRMMTNLVRDEEGYPSLEPEAVTIGMKVRVVFHDVTDEITLPKFAPA